MEKDLDKSLGKDLENLCTLSKGKTCRRMNTNQEFCNNTSKVTMIFAEKHVGE
ncbi:12541_t:CDS:2 [Rhizophagus irregularis]|nr:12541_t:CDS:2 [Rhizophagus irregularis]